MPKIILRTIEGKHFITEVSNWPDPWSVETPSMIKAHMFSRIESVYFIQTKDWIDNKRLYTEVPQVGEAIQYTTEGEFRRETNQHNKQG